MTIYAQLVEILKDREFELFTIRRSFDELSIKFSQLENAFAINYHVQRALEKKLKHRNLGEIPDENANEKSNARTELYSSLSKARVDKEHLKEAFVHQKRINEKQKLDHEKSICTIREECETILKYCRQNGEKFFGELLKMYEDSCEKIKSLEKASKASQTWESTTKSRIYELANLLETLKKFEGVRIEVLCQHAAEDNGTTKAPINTSVALRSLANDSDKPFDEGMKKLRQVTWDIKESDRNREALEFLQAQNSVLCKVIKNLKRKLQDEFHEYPENEEFSGGTRKKMSGEESLTREKSSMREKLKNLTSDGTTNEIVSFRDNQAEVPMKMPVETSEKCGKGENSLQNNVNEVDNGNENHFIGKSFRVEAFESQKNGVPYEEYIFDFFNDRQLRVKHSQALEGKNSKLNVEFVDSMEIFHEAPIDRTVFYLGENITRIVNFQKSSINCSVQTKNIKLREKCVQTMITGSNKFCRINAGIGMLNSEKRAIQRCLGKLENTVASLKENAIDKAHSMIGKNVKYIDDEFFDCLKRLETTNP